MHAKHVKDELIDIPELEVTQRAEPPATRHLIPVVSMPRNIPEASMPHIKRIPKLAVASNMP